MLHPMQRVSIQGNGVVWGFAFCALFEQKGGEKRRRPASSATRQILFLAVREHDGDGWRGHAVCDRHPVCMPVCGVCGCVDVWMCGCVDVWMCCANAELGVHPHEP